MDIWDWVYDHIDRVEEQDAELASQLWKLSSWVCDGEHAQVDAALPALVARLRHLDQPWLEVYARHWGLQSRVLHRRDVRRSALSEAMSLLERSSRDDAAECPQRTCVAQDVCAAYGVVDGPGYAEQRVQVADETLARISPAWPCYGCLTNEKAEALLDAGEPREALEVLTHAQQASAAASNDLDFNAMIAEVWLALGEPDKALDCAERADASAGGETERLRRELRIARCLIALGRHDEAKARLPPWSAYRGEAQDYESLIGAWIGLIRAGELTWDLGITQATSEMVRTLRDHQSWRHCLRTSLDLAELALDNDSVSLARVFVEVAASALPNLVAPLGDDARVAELAARVERATPGPLADTLEACQAAFEDANGEVSFDVNEATVRAFPAWAGLLASVADHWTRRGWPEQAEALLVDALDAEPDHPTLLDSWCRALIEQERWDELESLLHSKRDTASGAALLQVHWYTSQLRQHQQDLPAAIAALEVLIRDCGEHVGPGVPRRLVDLLEQAERFAEALDAQTAFFSDTPPSPRDWWVRIHLATLLDRWDLVREACAALELELDSTEGPIDEHWGYVKLQHDPGERPLQLKRTGPCTGTVVSITGPAKTEHHGEHWIFRPFRLGSGETALYAPTRLIHPSTVQGFAVDGARLDDDVVAQLVTFARQHGGDGFIASGDSYEITDPSTQQRSPGGYLKLAVTPDAETLHGLIALLESLTESLELPVIWPELAEAAGDTARAAQHRATAAAWEM